MFIGPYVLDCFKKLEKRMKSSKQQKKKNTNQLQQDNTYIFIYKKDLVKNDLVSGPSNDIYNNKIVNKD